MKLHTRTGIGSFAMVLLTVLTLGCSTLPPGDYAAGDYPVDVVLPAQTIGYSTGPCQLDVTIADTPISGATATVPAFTVQQGQTSITLQGVELYIPDGTVALGEGSLDCDGQDTTTVPFSVTFEGSISALSGTLDVATKTVSLEGSTIQLNDALLEVDGGPVALLPPVDVFVGDFTIEF